MSKQITSSTLTELLSSLATEAPTLRGVTLEKIHRTLRGSEENRFDFIMEDGIAKMIEMLRSPSCQVNELSLVLSVIISVTDDAKYLWSSIWEAVGNVEVLVQLLQKHHHDKRVFRNLLRMIVELIQAKSLNFQNNQFVQWMMICLLYTSPSPRD